MDRETVVEWYAFQCGHCRHSWTVRYDVLRAVDGEGTPWEFYWCHAAPAECPCADLIICPVCHHGGVHAHVTQEMTAPAG